MSAAVHVKHPGVARGDEALVQWLERQTVADQPSGEDRIGDFIER
jgi:hypothetical protein